MYLFEQHLHTMTRYLNPTFFYHIQQTHYSNTICIQIYLFAIISEPSKPMPSELIHQTIPHRENTLKEATPQEASKENNNKQWTLYESNIPCVTKNIEEELNDNDMAYMEQGQQTQLGVRKRNQYTSKANMKGRFLQIRPNRISSSPSTQLNWVN